MRFGKDNVVATNRVSAFAHDSHVAKCFLLLSLSPYRSGWEGEGEITATHRQTSALFITLGRERGFERLEEDTCDTYYLFWIFVFFMPPYHSATHPGNTHPWTALILHDTCNVFPHYLYYGHVFGM